MPHDYDSEEYTSKTAQDVAETAQNKVIQGFRNLGKGLANKAKSGLRRAGKKAATDVASAGLKIALKKYLYLGLVVVAIFFLLIIGVAALGNVLFEERGTTANYSLEEDEMNVSGVGAEDGVRRVIALTEPQALKTSYYRLMSCASYTKLINKDKSLSFYNPLLGDDGVSREEREDFSTLQDYFENERYFLLSSDFILMADEILHDYLVYYPEQVVKPVYHGEPEQDDEGNWIVKTKRLVDEEKNGLADGVESSEYLHTDTGDGSYQNIPTGNKIPGVWDYGLGSVLTYQPSEKNVWLEGTITERDYYETLYDDEGNITGYEVYRETVNEAFKYDGITLKGQKDIKIGQRQFNDSTLNNLYGNQTNVYPIKIPLINSAALFSGNVTYNYEIKETRNPFQDGTTDVQKEAYTTYQYGSTPDGQPLYEIRVGDTVTSMPEKVSEDKEVFGFDYIDDFSKHYKNYVPIGLKNDLEFRERTEESYDILIELGLLKPYTGEVGEVFRAPSNLGGLQGSNGTFDDQNRNFESWSDVTMMAHLIAAEAGNNKLDELMVGAVAVNRWKSSNGRLFDIISAGTGIGNSRQYACFWTDTGEKNEHGQKIYIGDGGTWAKAQPTEREIESAKQVISGEFSLPKNVIFQAQFEQGPIFMYNAPHYYCCPKGESFANVDSFGKVPLSAEQLQALATQLDGASPGSGVGGGSLGGKQDVEVTYYCKYCNSPPGSDAIAWGDGPSGGHAVAGTTCALSAESRNKLGVKMGDWIYIDGIGTRRVEDVCGTGLGTSIKPDHIVVDIYRDEPSGSCKCSSQVNRMTFAYKTTGEGSTQQDGYYSESTGLYYVDINNPYNLELFEANTFDTLAATSVYEKMVDPNQSWLESLGGSLVETLKDFGDLFHGMAVTIFGQKEDLFDSDRFESVPPSDTDKTHDIVYEAIAITQGQLYSDIVKNFDPNNMDLLFVGNVSNGGMFGQMGMVNGTGSTIKDFVSPTTIYYQPITGYSDSNPSVTLGTPTGTRVQAVYDGTVVSADQSTGTLVVDHAAEDGRVYRITYGNIDLQVTSGSVKKEQLLGTIREGGLIFKVLCDGKPVNPMSLFYQPTYSGDLGGLVQCAMAEFYEQVGADEPGDRYREPFGTAGTKTAWCAYFSSYCVKKVGFVEADMACYNGSCTANLNWYKSRNWFVPGDIGYIPKPGDLILFDWAGGRDGAEHIGIVRGYDGSKILTVEGNTSFTERDGAGWKPEYGSHSGNWIGLKERTYGDSVLGFCLIGGMRQ